MNGGELIVGLVVGGAVPITVAIIAGLVAWRRSSNDAPDPAAVKQDKNWAELQKFLSKMVESQDKLATNQAAMISAQAEMRQDMRDAISESRNAYKEIAERLTV